MSNINELSVKEQIGIALKRMHNSRFEDLNDNPFFRQLSNALERASVAAAGLETRLQWQREALENAEIILKRGSGSLPNECGIFQNVSQVESYNGQLAMARNTLRDLVSTVRMFGERRAHSEAGEMLPLIDHLDELDATLWFS